MLNVKTREDRQNSGAVSEAKRSGFDGTALKLIGWNLLASMLTAVTLGIAYPWAMCMVTRWKTNHTVINGRRLKFTGKGGQLFGKYLLWLFLTVITLGVYSIWFSLQMKKWQVAHTVYEDETELTASEFTAGAGGWFGNYLLCFLVSLLTLGIAYPWMKRKLLKWEAEHTYIGGSPLVFTGTGGQLFVKYLLLPVFTILTLGIYLLFFPAVYLKWQMGNTQALYCMPEYRQKSRSYEQQAKADAVRFQQLNNDSQLERVRSGVTGEESGEELRELADGGNRSAMYEYALRLKGESYEGESLEYLRASALAGYHPAMHDYAVTLSGEKGALYAQLLESSAQNGNLEAPWLLKQYYEACANKLHGLGNYDSAEHLQKAAYWFLVALEHSDQDALQNKHQYEKLADTVALWLTERRETQKKSSAGGVITLVLLAVLVLGGVCVWCWHWLSRPAPEEPEEIPVVALWCDGAVVKEDTALFQQVPWEPRVVSFENFEVTNTGDSAKTYTISFGVDQCGDILQAVLVTGRVSEGDMDRVMEQRENFVPLEDFARTVVVQPGETVKFAVILYWPEAQTPPEGTQIPAALTIYAVFTEQ